MPVFQVPVPDKWQLLYTLPLPATALTTASKTVATIPANTIPGDYDFVKFVVQDYASSATYTYVGLHIENNNFINVGINSAVNIIFAQTMYGYYESPYGQQYNGFYTSEDLPVLMSASSAATSKATNLLVYGIKL